MANDADVAKKKVDLLESALLAWRKTGSGFTHATNWGEVLSNALEEFLRENTGVKDAVLVFDTGLFVLRSMAGVILLQTPDARGMALGLLRSDGKEH